MKCLSEFRGCDMAVKIIILFMCSSKSNKTIILGIWLHCKHFLIFLNNALIILPLHGISVWEHFTWIKQELVQVWHSLRKGDRYPLPYPGYLGAGIMCGTHSSRNPFALVSSGHQHNHKGILRNGSGFTRKSLRSLTGKLCQLFQLIFPCRWSEKSIIISLYEKEKIKTSHSDS